MSEQQIGSDGHPIPEQQGIVTAVIQPIKFQDLKPAGKALGQARGAALHLPQFTHPPDIVPGSETNGVAGTGRPVLSTIECTELTLDNAEEAAERIVAMLNQLPLTESSVDVMNMAFAVIHYANKGVK